MRLMLLVGIALGVFAPCGLAAHPGHDEVTTVMGTVSQVEGKLVQVETFDTVSMQRKTVWIVVDEKTKFVVGRKRVEALELTVGQRIQSTVQTEDLPDGSIRVRAIQVRVNLRKKAG